MGVSGARIHSRVRVSPPMHHKLCYCSRSSGTANIQREEGTEEPGHSLCEGGAQETRVKTKIPLEDAGYNSLHCGA